MDKKREEEYVRKAQEGDVDAFSKLYEQINRELYRVAYFTLKNQQDAEDAVSETVIAAWVGIKGLRNTASFRGWIFRILSNQCKRKLKQYVEKPLDFTENIIELSDRQIQQAPDLVEAFSLKEAMKRLVTEDRLILSLSVFGGYTTKEIAKIMGLKHATVRSKKSRALDKLSEWL